MKGWTLAEIAQIVGGEVVGDAEYRVERPVPVGSNDPQGITFAESPKYFDKLKGTSVGAAFLPTDAPDLGMRAIRVRFPRQAFGAVLHLCQRPLPIEPGVHSTAIVDPSAQIEPSASVGPYVVIGAGVMVGAGAQIHPFTFVGPRCAVGAETILGPRVTLVQDVVLGDRCIVHPGAVIGADGFGFAWDGERHRKIPQVGGVRLGDDVEIGANAAVDRATAGHTSVGDDVKIDNLVQVAHNVKIGDHSILASQVGIAGSAEIGRGVIFGGQAGMNDHERVADGVTVGGQAGVVQSIDRPGEYFGTPAVPVRDALRQSVLSKRLPELFQRLKELERQLEALKKS